MKLGHSQNLVYFNYSIMHEDTVDIIDDIVVDIQESDSTIIETDIEINIQH